MTTTAGNSPGSTTRPAVSQKIVDELADSPLSVESLQAVMPKRQRHNITQKLVDELNQMVADPEARDHFRENLMGFSSVMADPNLKITSYIFAVKYVSYKLMGDTNEKAWIKTFPERHKRLIRLKKSAGHIRSTVSSFHKTKLVQILLEQSLIKPYVYNQDLYQDALNVQAMLMRTASSEKVRSDAANSLLIALKQPEAAKINIDVAVKEDDSIRELREATLALARQQRLAIEAGSLQAKDVAESKLIQGESVRID